MWAPWPVMLSRSRIAPGVVSRFPRGREQPAGHLAEAPQHRLERRGDAAEVLDRREQAREHRPRGGLLELPHLAAHHPQLDHDAPAGGADHLERLEARRPALHGRLELLEGRRGAHEGDPEAEHARRHRREQPAQVDELGGQAEQPAAQRPDRLPGDAERRAEAEHHPGRPGEPEQLAAEVLQAPGDGAEPVAEVPGRPVGAADVLLVALGAPARLLGLEPQRTDGPGVALEVLGAAARADRVHRRPEPREGGVGAIRLVPHLAEVARRLVDDLERALQRRGDGLHPHPGGRERDRLLLGQLGEPVDDGREAVGPRRAQGRPPFERAVVGVQAVEQPVRARARVLPRQVEEPHLALTPR
jgi:hypothetical protein